MHAGRHYTFREIVYWTRREIYFLLVFTSIPTILYEVLDLKISLPWLPVALIGTVVAFIMGFKNNATYARLWEARQIWGAIINASRSWGIMVKDYISNNHDDNREIKTLLVYRHIAWLTALRFQLREPRAWENLKQPYNAEFRKHYSIPEHESKLDVELSRYLPPDELQYILGKKNKATQIISLQSASLKELAGTGSLDTIRHVELGNMLVNLYDQQGKCERIKNFPYPRQFATLNLFFAWLFTLLVPFGMMQEFDKLGNHFVWLTIPFSTLVSWVFLTMEKIGEATENPFEGTANDIPMAALSRTIEIDLRDMLDEKDLPAPITPVNDILM